MADTITTDIKPGPFEPRGQRLSQPEKAALADSGLKYCPRCRSAKPFDEFHKDRSMADGLRGRCGACNSADKAAWQRANVEKVRAHSANCRRRNPEKHRAHVAAYKRRNPEKVRAWGREQTKRRMANLYRAKAVLERAIVHFEGRPDWLERIAHEIDESPSCRDLQFASRDLDGFMAAQSGDV